MQHASHASPATAALSSARVLQAIEAGYRALAEHRHGRALDVFLSAAETAPGVAAAWHGLGLASEALGQANDAVRFLQKASLLSESTAIYWRDLARALLRAADAEGALGASEKALALDPADTAALYTRAQALTDLKRYPEAIDACGEIAARDPDSPVPLNSLGNIMRTIGRLEEARHLYQTALRLDHNHAEAWHNLGAIHAIARQWPEAAACEAEAVNRKADFWQGYLGLGLALTQLKRYPEARTCFEQARRIAGDHADILMELGNLATAEHRGAEALEWYLRAANADAGLTGALTNAGNLLRINGRHEEALTLALRVVANEPRSAVAHNLAGSCLSELGRMPEALQCFQKAVEYDPNDRTAFSNLLYNLNFHSAFSAEQVYALHRHWGTKAAAAHDGSRIAHRTVLEAEKRLRIGYVSGDFRRHSVMYFLAAILRRHHREKFEVYCYSNLDREDRLTAEIRKLDLVWRDITALSDEAAARQIADDQIDILIDLAGHTGGNRLGIFARQPAPVQCSYLGYPNTTGLPTVAYRIVDDVTDPPGTADTLATERLVRLPGGFLCFSPPGNQLEAVRDAEGRLEAAHAFSIDITPGLPEQRRGHLTLGTFNNSKKIDAESARLWGTALSALPGAKLLLKGRAYQNPQTRQNLLRILALAGIAPERVEMRDATPSLGGHLTQYNDIDIALDTFPYNGTTTTCEALWMGVPVITLAGARHASRVGASLLHTLGRREWVAATPGEFTDACVRLARDPDLRSDLRRSLRQEMLASRLMNEEAFVSSLEEFFRSAWRACCSNTQPANAQPTIASRAAPDISRIGG